MKRRSAFFFGVVVLLVIGWVSLSGTPWRERLQGMMSGFSSLTATSTAVTTTPTSTAPVVAEPLFSGNRQAPYTIQLASGSGATALLWRLTVNDRVTGYAYGTNGVYEADGEVVSSTDALTMTAFQQDGTIIATATGTWDGQRFRGESLQGAATSALRLVAESATAARLTFERVAQRWEDPKQSMGCEYGFVLPIVGTGNGVSAASAAQINRTLRAVFTRSLGTSLQTPLAGTPSTLTQGRDAYLQACRTELMAEQKSLLQSGDPGGSLQRAEQTDALITFNQGGWLSLILDGYSYSGGAHGGVLRESYTFNLRTGQEVVTSDILRPGAEVTLGQRIASELVRQYRDELFDDNRTSLTTFANADASTAQRIWQSGDPGFSTSTNFFLVPNGMEVVFQQYEVAPYAVGIPQISLPFSRWQDLVRTDTQLFSSEIQP